MESEGCPCRCLPILETAAPTMHKEIADNVVGVYDHKNSNSYAKPDAEDQNFIDLKLYEAAKSGFHTFKEVLDSVATEKESAILQGVSPSGNTLLHLAAKFNQVSIAEYIAGVCPSLLTSTNSRGDTALHLAARAGHGDTAKILIHLKCDQVASSSSSADGNTDRVQYLNKELLRLANKDKNTALHEALIHGQVKMAETLIKADPEVSFYVNKEDKSPLYLATEAGYKELIAQMLEQPAEMNAVESLQAGKSPIHVAIINAETKRRAKAAEVEDILDVMLKKEPRLIHLRDEDKRTALHLAASIGYLDGVFYLLGKHRFAAFQMDKNGLFPIHVACIKGHVTVIKELLHKFPYPEEMLTDNCQNILHVAAKSGSYDVVSYILKAQKLEALINQRDTDGNTPLHLAAMNSHPKIVRILTRDKRVNLELVNKERFTALGVVEYQAELMPSFQKQLTWAALRAAGRPRAPFPNTLTITKETTILNGASVESGQSMHTEPRNRDKSGQFMHTEPRNTDKSGQFMHTEPRNTDIYKERVNTLLVVSTLIATVTFAAGFTAPGGYNESDPGKGMATLLKHKEFCLFILCDMIAMYSSITVAVVLIWAQLNDLHLVYMALRFALPLLGVALVMMSLAFMAAIYLVISKLQWLGYLVFFTGVLFLVVLSLLFFPLSVSHPSSNRILRFMFSYAFNLLVLLTSSRTSGHGSSKWR